MADVGTLGQLMQTTAPTPESDFVGAASKGIQTGMKLASEAQNLEAQKMQLEEMKEKLDLAKFNKAMSGMQTLARTRPEIAKRMVPKMTEQFRSAGIPIDSAVLEQMASDEAWKNRFTSIAEGLGKNANDPSVRMQFMASLNDIGQADMGLSMVQEQMKMEQTVALTGARLATTRRGQDLSHEVGTINAGLRAEGEASRGAKGIHKDPMIIALGNSANTLAHGKEIMSKPKITVEEFNDAQIELSNAIAGARSSALGKLERTEYHTYEQEWHRLVQKVTGQPQDAVPSAIKKQFTDLLNKVHKTTLKNREKRAQELAHTSNIPVVQESIDEAVSKYKVPEEAAPPAPRGSPAPTGTPAPKPSMREQLKAKYNMTDEQIDEFLKKGK